MVKLVYREFFMDLIISFLIAIFIGILPIKKLFTGFFFPHKNLFINYYDLKKCYAIWGNVSFFLPLLDFLKTPILHYSLNLIEIQTNTLLPITIMIVSWIINPLKDLFYGRGMSIFLGLFLVVNLEIFKTVVLIYLSILLLSRYQSAAGYLTGITSVPMVIYNVDCVLMELFLLILFSCTVIYQYKSSFYQILNKRFFHLSS